MVADGLVPTRSVDTWDLGTLLLTWFNFNCIMDKQLHPICEMKLLIHSQTSMVAPLKFGNG